MTPTRLVVGFVVGFLSVLTFQSGLIAIFHALDAIPFAPWRHDAGAALRRPAEPLGRVLGYRLRAPRAAAQRAARVVAGRPRVRRGAAGAGAVVRGAAAEGPAGRRRVRPAVAGAADGRHPRRIRPRHGDPLPARPASRGSADFPLAGDPP